MERNIGSYETRQVMLPSARCETVLVTGSSGTLGMPLCCSLAEHGYKVIAVDKNKPVDLPETIAFHQADINDLGSLAPAFASVDVVVHTAALHGYHLPYYSPDTFFTNNVRGVFNVLTACLQQRVQKMIFTSSTSVYGASADPIDDQASWLDESTPLRWREVDIYDATKVLGEELCEQHAHEHNMEIIALRTTRFFYDDYLSYNIRKLYRGIDLRDVVQAHRLAVATSLGKGYHVYNIVAKSPFQRSDAAELVANARVVIERYYPGVTEFFAYRNWELPKSIGRVYDITKSERELDFLPRYNFDEFLHEIQTNVSAYQRRRTS